MSGRRVGHWAHPRWGLVAGLLREIQPNPKCDPRGCRMGLAGVENVEGSTGPIGPAPAVRVTSLRFTHAGPRTPLVRNSGELQ